MSPKKRNVLVLSLLVLLTCTTVNAQGPEARDAKQDTKVSAKKYINNTAKYGAFMRCPGGEYFEITQGAACFVEGGESALIKIYEKDPIEKVMIYEVEAHNNWSGYICDDKGAIERGYAATFREIVLDVTTIEQNVCTTVSQAGHNTTESEFDIREDANGLYVEYRNMGGSWVPTGGYPNTTGPVRVDFSKIPD